MADIQCLSSDKTYNSLTVRMTNLQTDYSGAMREVKWFYVVADTDVAPWKMTGYEESGISYLENSSETQGDYTIYGLLANTTYYIRADITEESTGNTFGPFYGTATTLKSGFEGAEILISSSNANKIDVALIDVDMSLAVDNGWYTVEWWITTSDNIDYNLGDVVELASFSSSGTGASFTFTELEENTEYSIKCVIFDPQATEINRLYTIKKTPYIWLELGDITAVQIAGTKNMLISWTVNNYELVGRYVIGSPNKYPAIEADEVESSMIAEGTVEGKYSEVTIDCSSFESGEYYLAVCVYRKNIDESWVLGNAYITITDPTFIIPWSWEETESACESTPEQREKALYALENKGKTTDFAFEVWNDLVDKVREAYLYKWDGAEVPAYESKLDAAKMSEEDKWMTAERFNNVRYVIGSELYSLSDHYVEEGLLLYPELTNHFMTTDTWDMTKGEILKGEYIIELVAVLNRGIENLS